MEEHFYDGETSSTLQQTEERYQETIEECYRVLPLGNLSEIVNEHRRIGFLERMFKLSPADKIEMRAAQKVFGERTGKPPKLRIVMEMMDYREKTRELYENFPISLLQAIRKNYDNMGFWDSVFAPQSIVIEAEVAKDILKEMEEAGEQH